MNPWQTLQVSIGISKPWWAITPRLPSLLSVIFVLSQVKICRKHENDLSASVLPTGRTAKIHPSHRGKKIGLAFSKRSLMSSLMFVQCSFHQLSSLSKSSLQGITCSHFDNNIWDVLSKSSFLTITSGTNAHSSKCALFSIENLLSILKMIESTSRMFTVQARPLGQVWGVL